MRIQGIGTVRKEVAMQILTREGREAVKSGEITTQELGEMYKLHEIKKLSRIGKCSDLFANCYKWIPESLQEKLSLEELAQLTDVFYECYGAGKNAQK